MNNKINFVNRKMPQKENMKEASNLARAASL